jgi:tRNA 5-methylaminomethyl-2-thiouridine biosynthesis bifunctional protein
MTYQTIVPAELAYAGATPYSARYDDIYHSAQGGLEQARHVFLGGNDIPAAWRGCERFVILETGLGLGLNFLATWHAWRNDPHAAVACISLGREAPVPPRPRQAP